MATVAATKRGLVNAALDTRTNDIARILECLLDDSTYSAVVDALLVAETDERLSDSQVEVARTMFRLLIEIGAERVFIGD